MKVGKLLDWLFERATIVCGVAATLTVAALFYFLASESSYAFKREFPYGFRFALKDPAEPMTEDVGFDPYNSFLGAHPDGSEGVDEKEEGILMPTLEELAGTASFGTGTALTSELNRVDPASLYRDDWRAMKPAEKGDRFLLFGFATPEYAKRTMRLRWEPDPGFDPYLAPYDLKLRLLRAPDGAPARPLEVDLRKEKKGYVDLPAFVAKTDDDRTKGYVFELAASPTSGNFAATLAQANTSEWAPTNRYPRFGMWPLLLATLLITFIALLIAMPPSIMTALYLSEMAPSRLREWLKPVVELLASVPTVVLGYFGLMLVAPGLVNLLGEALQMQSGRSLLTAAIVMSILIAPTVISIAEDAMRSVPQNMRDGSLALGFSKGEMLRRILLPAARPGLIAAFLLGMARAIGETMIVWILSGGTALMPKLGSPGDAAHSLVQTTRGIPDTIGIEMANVEYEGTHYGYLFLIGVILFVLTTAINLAGYFFTRRRAWQV